uniref:NADPH oxidase activator 1 n=1 Tax=Bubo bubo TaxID=30461 RepID=A0A8C0FPJ1_BUBBB
MPAELQSGVVEPRPARWSCSALLLALSCSQREASLPRAHTVQQIRGSTSHFFLSSLRCRYEEALSDYHMAFSHLRKNPFIDYKQLGLRHILYAWEVLYSTAAAQCRLQQWQEARVTLDKAVVWRPEGRTAILDLALERVQVRPPLCPMHVPLGEFFRPRKKEVEQLDSKDFLGKPKVISSIIPNDEYIGFEPLRPQVSKT